MALLQTISLLFTWNRVEGGGQEELTSMRLLKEPRAAAGGSVAGEEREGC